MLKNLRTSFLVVLLGGIFIGQSVASSMMFYSMFNMDMVDMSVADMNMPSHDMEMMNHHTPKTTSNLSDSMTTSMQDSKDCCGQECQCLASTCSTVFAFSSIINTSLIFDEPAKIHSINSFLASQTLTSLFKPPILS